jgi:hypothetical protein
MHKENKQAINLSIFLKELRVRQLLTRDELEKTIKALQV